jgi:hypothetical protein
MLINQEIEEKEDSVETGTNYEHLKEKMIT